MKNAGARERFLRIMCGQMWAVQFIFVLNIAIVLLIGISLWLGTPTQETITISVITVVSSSFAIVGALVLSYKCKRYHFTESDPISASNEPESTEGKSSD